MKWRIYYDDGSTFDSDQGSPEDAPPYGFICAIGRDETDKRYIMHGWDYYQWDKEANQWWGMDRDGLIDRLCRNLVYAFKLGRTVSKTDFYDTMSRAHKDPDFPMS
jgi:hypothetical protein